MRQYEFALVLTESAGKDESKLKKQISKLVEDVKGKVKETKALGVKPLAYPIKKQDKGWYGIFMVELPEESLVELDKQIRLNEDILRYILVRA